MRRASGRSRPAQPHAAASPRRGPCHAAAAQPLNPKPTNDALPPFLSPCSPLLCEPRPAHPIARAPVGPAEHLLPACCPPVWQRMAPCVRQHSCTCCRTITPLFAPIPVLLLRAFRPSASRITSPCDCSLLTEAHFNCDCKLHLQELVKAVGGKSSMWEEGGWGVNTALQLCWPEPAPGQSGVVVRRCWRE